MVNFLIIDPRWISRNGMCQFLAGLSPGNLVLDYASPKAAVQNLGSMIPPVDLNLIIFGIAMENRNWRDELDFILRWAGKIPVMVMERHNQRGVFEYALASGGAGYLKTDCGRDELIDAISYLLKDHMYFRRKYAGQKSGRGLLQSAKAHANRRDIKSLTKRQKETLKHLMAGHQNNVIAKKLGISENTVRNHISAIFRAMKVKNRTQAALLANRHLCSPVA